MNLYLSFTPSEWDSIRRMAGDNERDPKSQMRHLIISQLVDAGYLPERDSVAKITDTMMAMTVEERTAVVRKFCPVCLTDNILCNCWREK